MYEQDPSIITQLLQEIIQQSIQNLAPIKIIQVSQKNKNPLTPETKNLMVQRDIALNTFKNTNNMEDLRFYKNLKNRVNHDIAKERYKRKIEIFQNEKNTPKTTWNNLKNETGQLKHTTPQSILEGSKYHTGHQQMADSLNRQYIRKINKIIEEMEPSLSDPLIH